MNLNMFFNLCWIWSKKASISSFYEENNFKPCLTKQLLNMFKLWCERGIRLLAGKFRKICTAFPLTTFWAKNSKWLPLKFPAKKSYEHQLVQKNWKKIANFLLVKKRKRYLNLVILGITFSAELVSDIFSVFKLFCTRWCFG